jgi:hypothetical protein
MAFLDRFVPELVRAAQAAQAENPRPVLAPSYPEPSIADKARNQGLLAWVVTLACAFIGLWFAFEAKKMALDELRGIAEGRRSPAGRETAITAWWLGQGMILIWWFTVLLIVLTGLLVVPIVILTS